MENKRDIIIDFFNWLIERLDDKDAGGIANLLGINKSLVHLIMKARLPEYVDAYLSERRAP